MLRNLLDLAADLADALLERITRSAAVAPKSYGVPDTWRPDHIHVTVDGGPCGYEGCDLDGFHFHENGDVYRTLREYETALAAGDPMSAEPGMSQP